MRPHRRYSLHLHWLKVGLIAAAGLVSWSVLARAQSAAPDIVVCDLKRAGTEFVGTCAIPCRVNALAVDIDGPKPGFTCAEPPRQVTARLTPTANASQWLGKMDGKFPEDPTRFELSTQVAKLPYGWFAVTEIKQSADAMALSISAARQLPPTTDDIKIIDRALALVADAKTWNRQDTRQCPPKPERWSVFCALTQATEEISGGVHYRQPALQAVREVLNEVGGKRIDKHRLMDYNNHADTTLADIHALLRISRERLEKRFR